MKTTRRLIGIVVVFLIAMASPGHAQSSMAGPEATGAQIASVAALRTYPPPPSGAQQVWVSGYYVPNDGGGGAFAWSGNGGGGDDGGMTIAPSATAGTGRWVRLLPVPGMVSPLYFGARCDGRSDDAPAINRAIDYIRTQRAYDDLAPRTGILSLPARQCLLLSTINATNLGSAGVMLEGTGGMLLCEARGLPCIDAMGSNRLGLRDITIFGFQKNTPRIGLQLGRISPKATAAGMYLDHVSISGFFSFAAFYNLNAETQLDEKLNASNQAPGGYGAVWDGYNHFNASSAFLPITSPVDHLESFGDNTCVSCRITAIGAGGIPMWAGGTLGLTFVNSYISNFGNGIAAVLYNYNQNLNFDVHFEAGGLTSVFLIAGNPHPVIYGLIYREHDFFGQTSLFALAQGVKAAVLENVDISIGRIHGNGTWFDDPAKYTVSGRVAGMYRQGWVTPGGGFSGMACFGEKCTMQ